MNEKEIIERLNRFKTIKVLYGNTFAIHLEQLEQLQNDIETVLNLLEKKDKIINLMAEEISENITNTCPFADYNYDLDCENKCNDNYKECWKQYFENKAKEVQNGKHIS